MDTGFARVELQLELQEVLRRLEPHHREVLMLRYYNDFSEPEIAEVLDVPLGTVKSRLHLARRKVEILLSPDDSVPGKERES